MFENLISSTKNAVNSLFGTKGKASASLPAVEQQKVSNVAKAIAPYVAPNSATSPSQSGQQTYKESLPPGTIAPLANQPAPTLLQSQNQPAQVSTPTPAPAPQPQAPQKSEYLAKAQADLVKQQQAGNQGIIKNATIRPLTTYESIKNFFMRGSGGELANIPGSFNVGVAKGYGLAFLDLLPQTDRIKDIKKNINESQLIVKNPLHNNLYLSGTTPEYLFKENKTATDVGKVATSLATDLMKLSYIGTYTAPMAPAILNKIGAIGKLAPVVTRMAAYGAQQATTYGIKGLYTEAMNQVGSGQLSVKNLAYSAMNDAVFGGVAGMAGSFGTVVQRVIGQGVATTAMGLLKEPFQKDQPQGEIRKVLTKPLLPISNAEASVGGVVEPQPGENKVISFLAPYLRDGVLTKEGLSQVAYNAILAMLFETINSKAVNKAYKDYDTQRMAHDISVSRLMTGGTAKEKGKMLTWKEAEDLKVFMDTLPGAIQKQVLQPHNEMVQIVATLKENFIPKELELVGMPEQTKYAKTLVKELKNGTDTLNALDKAAASIKLTLPINDYIEQNTQNGKVKQTMLQKMQPVKGQTSAQIRDTISTLQDAYQQASDVAIKNKIGTQIATLQNKLNNNIANNSDAVYQTYSIDNQLKNNLSVARYSDGKFTYNLNFKIGENNLTVGNNQSPVFATKQEAINAGKVATNDWLNKVATTNNLNAIRKIKSDLHIADTLPAKVTQKFENLGNKIGDSVIQLHLGKINPAKVTVAEYNTRLQAMSDTINEKVLPSLFAVRTMTGNNIASRLDKTNDNQKYPKLSTIYGFNQAKEIVLDKVDSEFSRIEKKLIKGIIKKLDDSFNNEQGKFIVQNLLRRALFDDSSNGQYQGKTLDEVSNIIASSLRGEKMNKAMEYLTKKKKSYRLQTETAQNNLYAEARKYKSAEEFAKAQGIYNEYIQKFEKVIKKNINNDSYNPNNYKILRIEENPNSSGDFLPKIYHIREDGSKYIIPTNQFENRFGNSIGKLEKIYSEKIITSQEKWIENIFGKDNINSLSKWASLENKELQKEFYANNFKNKDVSNIYDIFIKNKARTNIDDINKYSRYIRNNVKVGDVIESSAPVSITDRYNASKWKDYFTRTFGTNEILLKIPENTNIIKLKDIVHNYKNYSGLRGKEQEFLLPPKTEIKIIQILPEIIGEVIAPTKSQLTDIWNKANEGKFRLATDLDNQQLTTKILKLLGDRETVSKQFITDQQRTDIEKLNKELFGDTKINFLKRLVTESGQNALGSYKDRMINIVEGKADAKDTYYHEAVHKAMELLTDLPNRANALEQIKSKNKLESYELAEERLAEDFINYAKNREGFVGKVKTFFDTVFNRIKAVLGNEDKIKTLYNSILAGKVKVQPAEYKTAQEYIKAKMPQPIKNIKEKIQNNEKVGHTDYSKIRQWLDDNAPTMQKRFTKEQEKIADNNIVGNIVPPPKRKGGVTAPPIDFTRWKDRLAIRLSTETMERNIEDVAGTDAEMVKDFLVRPLRLNEVKKVKFVRELRNELKAKMKDFRVGARSKDSALVQQYGEKEITLDILKASTRNWENDAKFAEWFRDKYDMLLEKVNKERAKFGYEPIPKRDDYFRHFEEINGSIMQFGLIFKKEQLPTEIAGLTRIFKPGKPFTTAELARTGHKTTYDAVTGFDGYLESIAKQIYHIDSVQRGRSLEKYIRKSATNGLATLPNFVSNVMEWTNLVSGKKSSLDRGFEDYIGRPFFVLVDTLTSKASANMVGASISSALTNFAPFTQALATTGKISAFRGITDGLISPVVKDYYQIGGVDSSFLLRRFPSDKVNKTTVEKLGNMASWLFSSIDAFGARSIVSMKFYEQQWNGKTPAQAIQIADEYAGKVLAGRSVGDKPNIFSARDLKLISMFQLEVNNWYSFVLKDIPRIKQGSTLGILNALLQLFLYGFLFNSAFEKITGRRPLLDPIHLVGTMLGITPKGKGKSLGQKTYAIFRDIADNLPFVGGLLGGGRIPISSTLPDVMGALKGDTTWRKELSKPLYYLIPPFGGGQIKKTVEGIQAVAKGRETTASGNTKYEIKQTPMNLVKASLFGKSSLSETQKYYNTLGVKAKAKVGTNKAKKATQIKKKKKVIKKKKSK